MRLATIVGIITLGFGLVMTSAVSYGNEDRDLEEAVNEFATDGMDEIVDSHPAVGLWDRVSGWRKERHETVNNDNDDEEESDSWWD